VSPSVLGYLIHDQFFNHAPTRATTAQGFVKKIRNTVYLLSVKEWNLDRILYRVLWNPFKWAGKQLNFLDSVLGRVLVFLLFAAGIAFLFMEELRIDLERFLPELFSVTALAFIVKAFTERGNALRAWSYIFTSQLLIVLSICLNEHVETKQVVYYLSGTIVSGITGIICLWKIRSVDGDISLDRFHGYSYEQPGLALIFLLACLGLLGFPFTPTFIGIDLLFTHIHTHQVVLLISTALGFLVIELSVLRIYARIFLGQHKKMYHPVAYRSS
ncbi:MAG: hypothetical protein JWQ78_288, partial [Sediminibacterium sp.]|nr:hypothetical protein [Sediminibacterium sp.]